MNLKSIGIGYFFAIPDVISFLNLVFGFLAILMVFNQNLSLASMFIIVAMIFDSVDGWFARKTNRNDVFGFGKNIDSLADIVSFAVAPAILLYGAIGANGWFKGVVILVCLFMLFCGLLRLARYNVISDKIDFKGFIGFPIPATAVIVATYYLTGCFNSIIAMILVVFAGYLMISTIKYPKLQNLTFLGIGAILILLILAPINIVLAGINIPALLLLLLVLVYMLVPCLEFFLEVDNLFSKETTLRQFNNFKGFTGDKFNESINKASSKINSTKSKFSDMNNAINEFSADENDADIKKDFNKDEYWL